MLGGICVIKVLVVEDEPPIMRATVAAIEQSNSNFEVVATAINGKKAIEALEKQCIDIVFTDIRMPVMDGITLSEHIKNNYPNTITVLLSGYQDFEYAKKAIEFKVFDYLLKPISKQKLTELLTHLENEVQQKMNKKKKDMMSKVMSESNLQFMDSKCAILLVHAGAMLVYGNDVLVPAIAFWNKISVENIVAGILGQQQGYIVFYGNTVSERIIVIESDSCSHTKNITEAIFKKLSDIDHITITIACISDINLSEAGQSFHKLRQCVSENIILNQSQVLYCDELERLKAHDDNIYSKQQLESITSYIKGAEFDKVKHLLMQIFDDMYKYSMTQQQVTDFLDMVVNHYYFHSDIEDKSGNVIKKEIYGAIANFSDYVSLVEDVVSVLATLKSQRKSKNEKQPQLIDNIEQYLIKNYNESITNAVLSKEFGFVPSYISRLFRQFKGVSPSEYLTHFRIDKAKQIMKENPHFMVKEIADMVGFNEAYYFSKTFKKETGMWPSDYNKQ